MWPETRHTCLCQKTLKEQLSLLSSLFWDACRGVEDHWIARALWSSTMAREEQVYSLRRQMVSNRMWLVLQGFMCWKLVSWCGDVERWWILKSWKRVRRCQMAGVTPWEGTEVILKSFCLTLERRARLVSHCFLASCLSIWSLSPRHAPTSVPSTDLWQSKGPSPRTELVGLPEIYFNTVT